MKLSFPAIAFLLALSSAPVGGAAPEERTVAISAMTWYHPVLEPGLSDITLLCTVVSVEKGTPRYESTYWNVRLRIDERIYVDSHFEKKLENVRFVDAGDFRRRKVGERVVFFGGLGSCTKGRISCCRAGRERPPTLGSS